MRMSMKHSGFDGEKSYKAGVVDTHYEHAKSVFALGHGCPVNDNDKALPFVDACAALKLSLDERLRLAIFLELDDEVIAAQKAIAIKEAAANAAAKQGE